MNLVSGSIQGMRVPLHFPTSILPVDRGRRLLVCDIPGTFQHSEFNARLKAQLRILSLVKQTVDSNSVRRT